MQNPKEFLDMPPRRTKYGKSRGRPLSEEHRKKLSEAHKKRVALKKLEHPESDPKRAAKRKDATTILKLHLMELRKNYLAKMNGG